MIEIKKLTKYYGKFKSLDKVNLKVKDGIIFGFIGPNGAGKSTTIKCMMSILNYEGEIYFNKELITKDNINLKNKIGYLPSEIEIYEDMKVMDFIKYNNSFYNFDCLPKANELILELNLDKNKRISDLSYGNLKKLGIVIALMHNPKILILDEPTSGLDPLIQEVFYQILKREKGKGNTIFLSSHNLKEVSGLCDDVAIIKDGKIVKMENIHKKIADKIVTLKGNYSKIKSKIKDKIIEENNGTIKFSYSGKTNRLIEMLNEIEYEDLLIEKPELEDIFLAYYKED